MPVMICDASMIRSVTMCHASMVTSVEDVYIFQFHSSKFLVDHIPHTHTHKQEAY